jgi:hypothetical protein
MAPFDRPTMALQIESPSPAPPLVRLRELSANRYFGPSRTWKPT